MIKASASALSMPLAADETGSASTLDTSRFPAAAKLLVRLLARMQGGSLLVTFPDCQQAVFGSGPGADLNLHSWEAVQLALDEGDIGFARGYTEGLWTTLSLPALMNVLVASRAELDRFVYGSWVSRMLYRIRHFLNRNNRAGSRRNIGEHYDIGNDFYRLWLDESMTYSSALFTPASYRGAKDDAALLAAGQQEKYDRILDELQLTPGAQVLEIGCGWGGFARAASARGAHVTGLTLSTEQLQWASEHCDSAVVELRLQDYRDCSGQYDAIASIEMFEAVGEQWWPTWFESVARNLKPGGTACVQTIVIDEALFDRYRRSSDFIQQMIFPGGMLPSSTCFHKHAKAAGLEVVACLSFGADYARTLRIWRDRFLDNLPAVRGLGLDERFIRTWDLYLCYCEAAFRHGNTDVVQYTLRHAGARNDEN